MNSSERDALRAMSDTDIRKAQDLVSRQLVIAWQRGNHTAMQKLTEWEQGYADEMLRRLNGAS